MRHIISTRRGMALCLAFSFLTLLCNACGPSYPGPMVTQAITDMCKSEYDTDVRAKVFGTTLWVYLPLDILIDESLQVAPEAMDKIENATQVMQRVILSTDRKLNFYVLVATDTSFMGAEFTMIGHIPDIKRARFLDISRGEYQKRLIRDLKIVPDAMGDVEGKHVKLSDIQMSKFLAEQIIRRVQTEISMNATLSKRFEMSEIDWDYHDNVFTFFIYSLDNTPDEEPPLTTLLLKETAIVLHGYYFDEYTELQITDLTNDNTLSFTPEEVEEYRNVKIEIKEPPAWGEAPSDEKDQKQSIKNTE